APTAPVPFGDVIGRAPASLSEIASRIQVAARHRQRTHVAILVHPRAQRTPTTPVPFGDVCGEYITCDCETPSNVEVTQAIHDRRVNQAVRARNAAHADPIGVTEGWIDANWIHSVRVIHHDGEGKA